MYSVVRLYAEMDVIHLAVGYCCAFFPYFMDFSIFGPSRKEESMYTDFRKVPKKYRKQFKYKDATGKVTAIIKASEKNLPLNVSILLEDGCYEVAAVWVDDYYRYHDNVVYNTIKNHKHPVTEAEKKDIEAWNKTHPGEKPPTNWSVSLDAMNNADSDDTEQERNHYMAEAVTYLYNVVPPEIERLEDIYESFGAEDKDIYTMVVREERSNRETA